MKQREHYLDEITYYLGKRSRRRKKMSHREKVMRNRRILFCSILVLCCTLSFFMGRKSVEATVLISESDNKKMSSSVISDYIDKKPNTTDDVKKADNTGDNSGQTSVVEDNSNEDVEQVTDVSVNPILDASGNVEQVQSTGEYTQDNSTMLNDVGAVIDNATNVEKKNVGTIVLDAGHGGVMAGAERDGILEKDLDLAVAGKVAALLVNQGYDVAELRTTDEHISLSDRAYRTNCIDGASLFISIHANSYEDDESIEGIVTYYHPRKKENMGLAQDIQTAMVNQTGAVDRKINCDNFQVLREVKVPAVLIEMGYMTNDNEFMRLNDDEYQTRLAQGIVDGINAYFNQ